MCRVSLQTQTTTSIPRSSRYSESTHTHDQMHICVVICKHRLKPRGFLLLGSGDFIACPGGEFSSRTPHFCTLILEEETPLKIMERPGLESLEADTTELLSPCPAPRCHSKLALACRERVPSRGYFLWNSPCPPPLIPPPPFPGRLQRGCLHICRVEGFEQDVWHSSHLKRSQCQS